MSKETISSEDQTKRQVKNAFWSAVASYFGLTITNNSEPQPMSICHKCGERF